MRKHLTAVLIGSGAAALALGIGTAAMATTATTFTVKPGGAVTGTAGKTVLKDTKTGTVLTCVSSATKATLKKGSGVSGTALGKITSVTFSTCTGPGGLKFTATTSASTSQPVVPERHVLQQRRHQGNHHQGHCRPQRQRVHRDRGRHNRHVYR